MNHVPDAAELYIPTSAQARIRSTGTAGAEGIVWTCMRLSIKRPGVAWCLGCHAWFAVSFFFLFLFTSLLITT